MAIFHFTVKIVGRSKGKSIISASAYLNGDVMKNEETGKVSYYTAKSEIVYTQLMMCQNAPPEWARISAPNIEYLQKSIRYKRVDDKETALEKFKLTFRKQRLWNEVLKVEKDSNAQLARSFEFSLPIEWSRQEQIDYTTDFIQRNFVDKGMCADWSIHDKGDGNPHVHLLLTMRPFNSDHSWGNKEVKDWEFERDDKNQIIINPSHPNWWQDKKNPERCGIRIPVLDADGNQKVGSRNRKQWKRVVTNTTGWNNPKNCELWRSEWAKECNLHLPKEKQIDHRSFARQERIEIPTIHEGSSARMIEAKYQEGKGKAPSWKVESNQAIMKQNRLLQMLQNAFKNVTELLKQWKEKLDDIRREQGSNSHDGKNDQPDRGTTGAAGRGISGTKEEGRGTDRVSGSDSRIAAIKRQIADTAKNIAKYRRNVEPNGITRWQGQGAGSRKPEMERNGTEVKQREQAVAITECRIAEIKKSIEKARNIDDRINKIKARRTNAGTVGLAGTDADGGRSKGCGNRGATDTADRIAEIKRETQQREQIRKRTSVKERLEAGKRLVEERENQSQRRQYHDRGSSR